ncbi:unnamed protein product [Rotaria magnacalcarata]|uniref:Uncharacterized protein n=1 Tax=Rotaria magnacalcarata TaxID=392030 RepID=A0A820B0R5_9BILA|nr:unnamed protein product [Rotaria magnacalcarata]
MDDNVDSNDSVVTVNNEATGREQENLLSTSDASEHDEDDSLLGATCYRKDIYVCKDGKILYGQQAIDERKQSIARREALDLQKLLEKSSDKLDSKIQKSSSTFSTNIWKVYATNATKTSFTSTSSGHLNALTAHAKAANVSATATAEIAAVSTGTAYTTGANASASASSSVCDRRCIESSCWKLNVSVTGAETAASVSASAVKVMVGNVDVTGASAGAIASVNGAVVSAFNVAIGGASVAASVNVDGSLSFGNVNLGLRPSLDIDWGLNIGVPFLSGSRTGSAGGEGPKRDNATNEQSSSQPAAPTAITNSDSASGTPPSNNKWSGMYNSPSPAVAAGYAMNDQGRPSMIDQVYLPEGAADMYHTTVLNMQPTPDLRPPATVICPAVHDEALATGNIRFEPSAHGINRQSYRMDTVYERELESSLVIPYYMINMTKGPADCERDGGRERLGHVFQGRLPYGYETVPLKKKELSDDDKLLLEESRKLGFEVPLGSLDEWVKKLRSDEGYEREEDAKNRRAQSNNNGNSEKSTTKQDKEESEEENEPPKPCKDHPINVRCMKCISGSSGPRVRQLHGRIHGFKFNN